MKKPSPILLFTVAAAVSLGSAAAPAQAHEYKPGPPEAGTERQLASGLALPLKLAVDAKRRVTVSENSTGTFEAPGPGRLTRVARNGETTVLYSAAPRPDVAGAPAEQTEVGAVSIRKRTTYFVETRGAGRGDPAALYGQLKSLGPAGVRDIVDLAPHERATNPDGGVHYGFQGLDEQCAALLPAGGAVRADYTGIVDSHPYATAATRSRVYVADAGANAILRVNRHTGNVSTLAVLPPVSLTVTAEIREQLRAAGVELDECVLGHEYLLEPVPTDVEVSRSGWVYASILPGAGEIGLPLGAVYRIHPRTGEMEQVAGGFAGATGLALGARGELYVAEMFGGRVAVVPRGSDAAVTFIEAQTAADVEVSGRSLYGTVEALSGAGRLIKVPINYPGGH